MPFDEYGNEIPEEQEPTLPERKNRYAGRWDVRGSPMSPRIDILAAEQPVNKNKYSGRWDSLPTPPPMPPKKSRWAGAREMAKKLMVEGGPKVGEVPIAPGTGPSPISKYTDPEYTARADTAEHFKKTVSNFAKSAKGLIPGLVTLADKTVGAISRPGHAVMERGMEQAAIQKAREMGMEPQAKQGGGALEPIKNVADFALWAPKLIADVINDPIGTVENRSFDIAALAAGGALHKGIKKAREPISAPTPDVAGVIPKEQMPIIPGPGEVKGLGIEFVDDAGRPISRAEAFRGRQAKIEPSVEEPGKMKAVISPLPPSENHIVIIQNAIKEAPKLIKEQEALRHLELQKRAAELSDVGKNVPGEAGYYAKLGKLNKPLPSVKATFGPVKQLIPQENVDGLFNIIEKSPDFTPFNKIAIGNGLLKILDGEIPQPSQLRMLEKLYGPEFVKTVLDKRSTFTKAKSLGIEIANIPRAWMASCDLSFGLRQGIVMAFTHPVIFWRNFPKQFQYLFSDKIANASNAEIAGRPSFELATRSKLSLTNMDRYMELREEPFQSRLAERIPIMGEVVKASNRAYSGFANRLRMDVFDYLVKRAEKAGRDPWTDIKLSRDIATVVNTGTGRGSLGSWERIGPALNAIFFSPKLAVSRLQMFNPHYYWKLDKFARVEALKQLISTGGAGITILGLAKMAGAEVGTDWRSADFGKIKIGNTRLDIGGGFLQYIRLVGQLSTGEVVSSTTGKVSVLGEGYRPRTRWDIAQSALEYKTAPVVSFAISLLKGQESFGGEFKLTSEITKRLVPIIIQDLVDVYKDDPSLLPISALGIFGVGLQTYNPSSYKKRRGQRTSLQW